MSKISSRCFWPALLWALGTTLANASDGDLIDPASGPKQLLEQFRKARSTPESRTEVVDRLLSMGLDSGRRLQLEIERELRAELDRYQHRLIRDFTPLLRARRNPKRELRTERETVLNLTRSSSLTTRELEIEASPALERLERMLVVEANEALAASSELESHREKLLRLGEHWQKCEDRLSAKRPKGDLRLAEPGEFSEILQRYELLAAALAMPIEASDKKVLLENRKVAWQLHSGEALGIADLNVIRLLLGLPAVRVDPNLCAAARDHSHDMRTRGFFSHMSPVPGKRTPSDRASRFNTSAATENIAQGGTDPKTANRMWFHSPGHHQNMLGSHGQVGLGRSEGFWTMMFG